MVDQMLQNLMKHLYYYIVIRNGKGGGPLSVSYDYDYYKQF